MNLSALMNDGGEEGSGNGKTEAQRSSQPPAILPISNGHHLQSYAQAPGPPGRSSYPPPPLVAARSSGSQQSLTPLHTPGQATPASQYQFPATPGHPSAGADYRYRSQEGFYATTPGGRPSSHGLQYPFQSSPSGGGGGMIPPHQPTSASPTPSSHHSQTPHSVRQSPLAVMAHAPQPVHQQYQQSQPSTPLGPPTLQSHRSAGTYSDFNSPYHQRTLSGTSNGVHQSPAAIANLVESPNAFHRPSPTAFSRPSSQYISQHSDRERSLSVSPKTMVAPRPPSLGSRHSSLQEMAPATSSSRSSGQHPQQQQTYVQSAASHVSQPAHFQHGPPPVAQAQPLPNLNGTGRTNLELAQSTPSLSPNMRRISHPHPQRQFTEVSAAAVEAARPEIPQPSNINIASQAQHQRLHTQMSPAMSTITDRATEKAPNPLKRPAPEAAQEPPAKRKMARKYTRRPPWAVLSRHNPRSKQQDHPNGQPPPLTNPQSNTRPPQPMQIHSQPLATMEKLWEQDPPLDGDLIRTRAILGKWEKTFKWNIPYPDMLRAVQDWLYLQLLELQDVGMDPREGTIEIEARVGILMQSGTDDRCRLPVRSSTVIDPLANNMYHFESRMTGEEHKAMNEYLNASTQDSMQPGRVAIKYNHPNEVDSFHALSPEGLAALPASLQRRSERQRPPRLRVTRDMKKNDRPIIGKIVKIHISDLHIYNPQYKYDTRISIALEVNLDRPDLNFESLIATPGTSSGNPTAEKAPDRVKDRLSYKHLAYSIDLTKVENPGSADVSYELEVEVDSRVLREQMTLLQDGRESAFGDVVSGFLDNITFLTRQGSVA